jgi:hypothetical protein
VVVNRPRAELTDADGRLANVFARLTGARIERLAQ